MKRYIVSSVQCIDIVDGVEIYWDQSTGQTYIYTKPNRKGRMEFPNRSEAAEWIKDESNAEKWTRDETKSEEDRFEFWYRQFENYCKNSRKTFYIDVDNETKLASYFPNFLKNHARSFERSNPVEVEIKTGHAGGEEFYYVDYVLG